MTGTAPTVYSNVLSRNGNEMAINYFFFYPRSNWEEHGGANTHEGDWEGITVFLIKSELGQSAGKWVPSHIALAQHVDIADNLSNLLNTDGGDIVDWTDPILALEGSHPHLYVGLGSHATFAYEGETEFGSKLDCHTTNDEVGISMEEYIVNLLRASSDGAPDWLRYTGIWGSPGALGSSGIRGPVLYNASFASGFTGVVKNRWLDPWEWSSEFNNIQQRL